MLDFFLMRTLIKMSMLVLTLVLTLGIPAVAENLGTLFVSAVLLRPNFTMVHPGTASFNSGESSIAVQWTLNDNFSGHVRIGCRELINQPGRFISDADLGTDLQLAEA